MMVAWSFLRVIPPRKMGLSVTIMSKEKEKEKKKTSLGLRYVKRTKVVVYKRDKRVKVRSSLEDLGHSAWTGPVALRENHPERGVCMYHRLFWGRARLVTLTTKYLFLTFWGYFKTPVSCLVDPENSPVFQHRHTKQCLCLCIVSTVSSASPAPIDSVSCTIKLSIYN